MPGAWAAHPNGASPFYLTAWTPPPYRCARKPAKKNKERSTTRNPKLTRPHSFRNDRVDQDRETTPIGSDDERTYRDAKDPSDCRAGPTRSHRADIPAFWLSSSDGIPVSPGGGFVVAGVGLQAAVQDANEAVAELS